MSHGVIYIDAFFMVNLWMDIILLAVTAGISRISTTFPRILSGALTGALWAVVCIIVSHNKSIVILTGIITYLVIGIAMVRITFGRISLKKIIRSYLIMLTTACTMGGIINLVGGSTMLGYCIITGIMGNEKIYAAIIIAVIPVFYFIRLGRLDKVYGSGLCQVDIKTDGGMYRLTGLIDTGNRLRDPIFDTPVHVINSDVLKGCFPEKIHYIPYNSVGNEHGIIPAAFCESMTVYMVDNIRHYDNAEIALYNGKISSDNEYDILLNSEIIK